MSSIQCACGYRINLNFEESEIEYALIPESWVDNLALRLEKNHIASSELFDSFLQVQQTIYKCPNCYRLWFENSEGTFDSYIPEYKCKRF